MFLKFSLFSSETNKVLSKEILCNFPIKFGKVLSKMSAYVSNKNSLFLTYGELHSSKKRCKDSLVETIVFDLILLIILCKLYSIEGCKYCLFESKFNKL